MSAIPTDLTPETDDAESTESPSLPAPSSPSLPPRIWQRWTLDGKTRERSLETYPLRPYKRSVEDLWHRLCEIDAPLPTGSITQNLDAFAGCAIKLLYLLSHDPAEYRHLRADPALFAEAIEDWADENVPREKTVDAVNLVLSIHNSEAR